MNTKKHKKNQVKLFRILISLFIGAIGFYLIDSKELEAIKPDQPPIFYSNVCGDNLEKVFLKAIQGANQSILLIIYSLSETKLIKELNQQAEKGIAVKVIHDASTAPYAWQNLSSKIETEDIKIAGLMHQKILVVDKEKIWLGSANLTSESLKLHDNLVIGLINHQLAETIDNQRYFSFFNVGGQEIEYWALPQKGKEGLKRLIQLLDEAKICIRIAMFTWTHSELTKAAIRAHQRGVKVEIILDHGQANGVCRQTLESLVHAGIYVRLSSGLGLLHHKFAWIDEKWLVNGSANWTNAAFLRNQDCFLILHSLTDAQNAKLHEMWKKTQSKEALSYKKHLSIFWQRPTFIRDQLFEVVDMAA